MGDRVTGSLRGGRPAEQIDVRLVVDVPEALFTLPLRRSRAFHAMFLSKMAQVCHPTSPVPLRTTDVRTCPVLHNADMGLLRDLLLVLNRHGRAVEGSAAFPRPPELHVPPGLKEAIDAQEPEGEEPDPSL